MGAILDFIARYLGKFLYLIYDTIAFHNYGIALIFFTIFIKLALLPLTMKQYHSTAKMQELQPQLQKLQKRYKNDKEKLNQETMKLYQEKGVNPAGGCLPMLFQMPILFALFYVIRRPMTYVLNYSSEKVGELILKVNSVDPSVFSKTFEKIKDFNINEITLTDLADKVSKADIYFEARILNSLADFPNLVTSGMETIKLTFLKIFNLGLSPTLDMATIKGQPGVYIPLIVLVLIAAATTYISSKIMMAKNSSSNQSNDQMGAMSKNMMYMGPLMTLWIGFMAPAGLALYWTISNVVQIIQQWYINNHVIMKKEDRVSG